MLYDFINADKSLKTPLYRQIYYSIRNYIENGSLKYGTKAPSIRKLSESLDVSKTTVKAAYDQLCAEGYLKTKPQSGYFVAAQFDKLPKNGEAVNNYSDKETKFFEYDFSGKSIDKKIIDFTQWKKNIREVINSDYLLLSYGDAQGELKLREALQRYALGVRSVNSRAENIIVAAGTQPLLSILCAVAVSGKRVAMEKRSFVQSELVFKSCGCRVFWFESDENGVTVQSLEKIKPDFVLINPNFSGTGGSSMPVSRRLELISWAKENGAYIIEDDYNGELRYSTHPVPCVQNYDSENTVYIGSFSKVLLPSVRISYAVLPDKLMDSYRKIMAATNQTASKTEQLALASYLDGKKFDAHLRKARRVYLEKSRIITKYVKKLLPVSEIIFNETALYLRVRLTKSLDYEKTREKLNQSSVRIMPYQSENEIGLSFSGIAEDKIEEGVRLIARSIT
ncbi:MAG TPA: hypothetical protein DEO32_03830 [Ruminococcaceae bacterium]|nr:hypothetical protein [Oscillospiraceae bacterium]